MPTRDVVSYCRICQGCCGVRMTLDERDHVISIRGDTAQLTSNGYACFKGLQVEEAHHGQARLLHPLRRMPDGHYQRVDLCEAFDEIAARMKQSVLEAGGQSVGVFAGGGSLQTATAHAIQRDFLRAIGSDQYFSTVTIDQSAKIVSFERMGGWAAGLQDFDCSDVVLFIGNNPLVSHSTVGLIATDPVRRLKAAKQAGIKIICIDPRRTETAHQADLFLQPLPGHDAAIVAALIRIVLAEGWEDAAFCARWVGAEGMAKLQDAVAPFDAASVEQLAGLQPGALWQTARMFGHDNKRGAAFAATGPSMAPFSNLMQHMVDCLNIVCARFRQAGDVMPVNPLEPPAPVYAEVIPPPRSWDQVPPSRIRGVGRLFNEKLTATLAEEILQPGEGQIRCMIVDGGNAANCVPDQAMIVEAFKSLDLLVVIDPYMTVTAQLADFIIPPTMMYERPDIPFSIPGFAIYPYSWTQYTPAVMRRPEGSELIENWEFYWEIARRLGLQIRYDEKIILDMATKPTNDELLAIRMDDACVSYEELKRHPSGLMFDLPHGRVLPAREGAVARFDVMPADVESECACLLGTMAERQPTEFTHLLASRRLRETFNSIGTMLPNTLRRRPYNPAFMNLDDMAAIGLSDGDEVEIASAHGSIVAIAQPDPDLRCGVVSVAHGWGGHPGISEGPGTSVNLLTNCRQEFEPINAMPVMSAIPVKLRAHRFEMVTR